MAKTADAERDFLLPAPAAAARAPQREWNGHLLNPCGDCDVLGARTCLITHYLPCITFGRTVNRAFAKSAVKAGLLFASLLLVSYAHRAVQVALVVNDCVAPPEPAGALAEQPPRRMGPGFHGPPEAGAIRLRCAKPFGARLDAGAAHAERCAGLVDAALTLNLLTVVALSVLVALGSTLRSAMRERHGIAGSRFKDFMAWLCCMPCAMCQEARTMEVNNVEGGVWHGAQELACTRPATAPPAVPVMYYEPLKPARVDAAVAAATSAAPSKQPGKADAA